VRTARGNRVGPADCAVYEGGALGRKRREFGQ